MNKALKASITDIGIAATLLLLVGCSSSDYFDVDVHPKQPDTDQQQATQNDLVQDDAGQGDVVQGQVVQDVDNQDDVVQDVDSQDDVVQDNAVQGEVVQDDAGQDEVVQDDATQENTAQVESTQEQPQQESEVSVSSPGDVRGTQVGDKDVKWEWAVVPNALSYEVYLDGILYAETQDDFLYTNELSGSEHSVTVVAVDSEGRRSIKSESAVVAIDSDLSVRSENVAPPPANNVAPPPVNQEDDTGLIDPASWSYNEVYEKPGYSLVFSDEFEGNSLNRARWNTNLRWDGSFNGERYEYRLINGESQYYVNIFSEDQEHLDKVASVFNPFELNGNRLAIRSIRNPLKNSNTDKSHGPLHEISTQQPFLSGAMSTYGKFYRKYGYFEARIKIPAHLGTFPAFWLHHQNREKEGTQRTEIDIMENLGHAPWYVYNAFHYFTGVSEGVTGNHNPTNVDISPDGQIHTGIDYSNDYHVYAVEWSPGKVRYFIDGQEHNVLEHGAVDFEELYININLAVGGDWTNRATNAGGTGRAAENNPFPNQQDIDEWQNPALEIDYVRVYAPE